MPTLPHSERWHSSNCPFRKQASEWERVEWENCPQFHPALHMLSFTKIRKTCPIFWSHSIVLSEVGTSAQPTYTQTTELSYCLSVNQWLSVTLFLACLNLFWCKATVVADGPLIESICGVSKSSFNWKIIVNATNATSLSQAFCWWLLSDQQTIINRMRGTG